MLTRLYYELLLDITFSGETPCRTLKVASFSRYTPNGVRTLSLGREAVRGGFSVFRKSRYINYTSGFVSFFGQRKPYSLLVTPPSSGGEEACFEEVKTL